MTNRSSYLYKKTMGLLSCVLFMCVQLAAQCPELTNITFDPPYGSSLCPGDQITIGLEGQNLPQGTIDWYVSDTPDYNPYEGEGTYIGESFITPDEAQVAICDPCPELVAIMIDACNPQSGPESEAANEFLIISSGGGIAQAGNIQVNFDGQNNAFSDANNDINYGNNPCGFANTPNPSLINNIQFSANCNNTNIVPAGPTTPIPAGALVIVFTSNNTDVVYNFDGLCQNGETLYILQSNCTRTAGAFTNSSSSTPVKCRDYSVYIDCDGDGNGVFDNCNSTIAYNYDNTSENGGQLLGGYVYAYDANGNGQIDYGVGCNPSNPPETIHVNNTPCAAPPVESIPIPPIPSTITDFFHFVQYSDCGQGPQEYYIQGIINPLYDDCVSTFNPDYSPYLTDVYAYTVDCMEPELEEPPQLCVGQSYTLDDLVVDIGQYTSSGWLDNENPFFGNDINVFTPNTTGTETFYFFPIGNGNECFGYASATFEVVDGIAPQLATDETCQSNSPYDLTQLEDANYTGGTWQDADGNTIADGMLDISTLSGEITLSYLPDANGGNQCATEATTEITINAAPELDVQASNDLDCSNTTATLSANATGSGLTYQWVGDGIDASNENEAAPTVSASGMYVVTVTNGAGCSAVDFVQVNQNTTDAPDVSATISTADTTTLLTCANIQVQLLGDSESTITDYTWEAPDGTLFNEQNPTVDQEGVYTLTVTDDTGCTNAMTLEVEANTSPPVMDILLTNNLSCLNDAATLFGNSPMTNDVSFEWLLDGNFFSNDQNINIDTSQAGVYELIVTDSENGCTSTSDMPVAIDTLSPNAQITPISDNLDCVQTEVALEGTSSTANVSYEWQSPSGQSLSGSSPLVDEAGVYTLIVTAANGCTATDTAELQSDADLPSVAIDTPDDVTLNCTTTAVSLNGTSDATDFQWSTPDGTMLPDASISATEAGVYTLTVNDATTGCSNTASVTVEEDTTPPMFQATGTGMIFCNPNTTTLTATPSDNTNTYTYQWFDEMGNSVGTNADYTASAAGVYEVVATGTNGCTSTATSNVSIDNSPPTVTTQDVTLDCSGNPFSLTANSTDDVNYEWYDADNNLYSNQQNPNVTETGTYTLIVTDNATGCTATNTAEVSGTTDLPVINQVLVSNEIDCTTQSATLSADVENAANLTLSWRDANDMEVGTGTEYTAMQGGTYTLVVTDPMTDCASNEPIEVEADTTQPEVTIQAAGEMLSCALPELTLFGNSPNNNATEMDFVWAINGVEYTQQNLPIDTSSAAGTYLLTVTDPDNGCTNTADVLISINTETPTVTTQDVTLDCSGNPFSLTANSTDDVSFTWYASDGEVLSNTASTDVSEVGIYNVVVTENTTGCTETVSAEALPAPDAPQVTIDISNQINCDNPTASMTATVMSTAAVSYTWTDEAGSILSEDAFLEVDVAGVYELTVLDTESQCSSTISETVIGTTDLPAVNIALTSTENILDCDTEFLTLEGSSDNDVTYTWTGPNGFSANTPVVEVAEEGTYTLVVQTLVGDCTNEMSFEVFDDYAQPAVQANGGVINCLDNQTTLSASTAANVTYAWTGENFSSTDAEPMVSEAGAYVLTVTAMSNGCTAQDTAYVQLDESFPTLAATASTITCQSPNSTLDASASTPPGDSITYHWVFEGVAIDSDVTTTVSNVGVYELVGINNNSGCADTMTVEVLTDTNDPEAAITTDAQDLLISCDQPSLVLDGESSTAQGDDLAYVWLDVNGDTLSEASFVEIQAGMPYTLVVTDMSNGCSDETSLTIEEDTLSPLAGVMPVDTITCDQTTVVLDAGISQGATDLTYQWLDTNNIVLGTEVAQAVSVAGVYTLTVMNAENGCDDTLLVEVAENTTPPAIEIAQPDTITCITDTVILDASSSDSGNNFTTTWSSMTGTVSDLNSLSPSVNQAGIYELTLQNLQNGCSDTQSIEVVENRTPPLASASVQDDLGCTTDNVELYGTGSSEGSTYEYLWTGPAITSDSTTLNINAAGAGVYQLLVTNTQNGCTNIASIDVPEGGTGIQTPTVMVHDESCSGDANGIIQLTNVQGGTPPYMYALNESAFSQNPQFYNLSPGTYTLAIQDVEGCEWTEEVSIEAATPLIIELGDNIVVPLGESVNLDVQTNALLDTLIWSDASLSGANPSIMPSNTTTVSVTAIDENGCTEQDAITIVIEKNRPVFIPSAFSPNEDGINDVFMIYGSEAVANVRQFQVFDRWGELVFSDGDFMPNDINHGWNGLFRNKNLDPAVFVYYAEIEFTDGLIEVFKGDVSLLR